MNKRILILLTFIASMVNATAYDLRDNDFYYAIIDDDNMMLEKVHDGNSLTKLVIPETVEYKNHTYKISKIKGQAFKDYTSLTSVSAPNVIEVGDVAFQGCTALKTVNFPKAETIGYNTFYNCSSLQTVELPAVKSIEKYAFSGCEALTDIKLNAVSSIDIYVFQNCTALQTVTMPTVKSIGKLSFTGCTALHDVTLSSVETIGESAFKGDTSLTKISLDSVRTIGRYAFALCTNLRKVVISNMNEQSTVSIGESAFSGDTNLKSIIINRGKISKTGKRSDDNCNTFVIGSYAFKGVTPYLLLDMSDRVSCNYNKATTVITNTEERADVYRNADEKYRPERITSYQRMEASLEDVNMDGKLGGDDVQEIYNKMK